jgi:DNA-binding CsgD family transcriptional regulator
MQQTINVADVVYREDLYPRIKPDAATIQRYAENLDVLPAIEINQNKILIDGFHRWTAHRKAEAQTISATVTETASEAEIFALAIQRNAAHGLQMNEDDKRKAAIRLYGAGTGLSKDEIAKTLSVTPRSINNYLSDIDKRLREERKERIFDLWMACHTQEEIAPLVGLSPDAIGLQIKEYREMENIPNIGKVAGNFQDQDFTPPLFNIWTFAKKTNGVSHFGNSEQRIVDNLLYLYTNPFDIVVDPFAGGGSTIDVCKRRLRRHWVSDRKPIVERESEIRQHDLNDGPPQLNRRWSDVTLTYLDPPYWRQAAGQYSNDPQDLANMPLDQFTETLARIVKDISQRQSRGVIALLIQPTQWSADNKQYTDHVTDLVRAVGNKRLVLENRVSCPYSTEQYNAQQVEYAKANKKLLVITRELIIWRIA